MAQYANLSDPELVDLLQKDEIAAFVEIYERYWSKLFGAAYNRLRDEEVCKEIVQEIFTAFWSKRKTLILQVGLSNYLFRATKHQVIDHLRKKLVRRNFDEQYSGNEHDDSNQQWILLRDLQQSMDILVEGLPDKCRSVYRMSRMEHRSNREIAKILDISEKTVEGHLTKALKLLQIQLSHFLLLALTFFLK